MSNSNKAIVQLDQLISASRHFTAIRSATIQMSSDGYVVAIPDDAVDARFPMGTMDIPRSPTLAEAIQSAVERHNERNSEVQNTQYQIR